MTVCRLKDDDKEREIDFCVAKSSIGNDDVGTAGSILMLSSMRDCTSTPAMRTTNSILSDHDPKDDSDDASDVHSASDDFNFLEENEVNDVVSKKDLESVRNMKILILFALFTSLCGAVFVYYQNLQVERVAFEHYFQADSSKVCIALTFQFML
jgi:hypothetical protein